MKSTILGILNLTHDSFSDGSISNLDPQNSLKRAQDLIDTGADYLDIGAESTRPGANPVSTEEEFKRLSTFLDMFCKENTFPLSIDTRNPEVLKQVLDHYYHHIKILNDVSGFQDTEMVNVVASYAPIDMKIIITHNKGGVPPSIQATEIPDDFYLEEYRNDDSEYDLDKHTDLEEVALYQHMVDFFQQSINKANEYGISKDRLILDLGFGFGKNLKQSLMMIDLIPLLDKHFELPVMVGASRKSFLKLWEENLNSSDIDELSHKFNYKAIKAGASWFSKSFYQAIRDCMINGFYYC